MSQLFLLFQCNLGKLHYTSKRLFGADHNGLRVMGTVRGTLSLGETCVTEDIYVVKGLKEPPLGQPAIEKLNLLARINEIQSQSYSEIPSTVPVTARTCGRI